MKLRAVLNWIIHLFGLEKKEFSVKIVSAWNKRLVVHEFRYNCWTYVWKRERERERGDILNCMSTHWSDEHIWCAIDADWCCVILCCESTESHSWESHCHCKHPVDLFSLRSSPSCVIYISTHFICLSLSLSLPVFIIIIIIIIILIITIKSNTQVWLCDLNKFEFMIVE